MSMLAVVLAALVWVGWEVRGFRAAADKRGSGVTLEWTVRKPDREPVKITLELIEGQTREEWELRLHEALERAGAIE